MTNDTANTPNADANANANANAHTNNPNRRTCGLIGLGCFAVAALQHYAPSITDAASTHSMIRRGLSALSDPQTRASKEKYLKESITTVEQRVGEWIHRLPSKYDRAQTDPSMKTNHARFFPFEPLVTCRHVQAVGGEAKADTSKLACGVENLQTPGCVIYSIGGDNNWDFENDLIVKTACEIHTFDCTGPTLRFTGIPLNDRVHFHHICLGFAPAPPQDCSHDHALCGDTMTLDQIQSMLGHETVDVLKIDIEGWEVPIIRSWATAETPPKLPRQILMELHWRSQFLEVPVPNEERSRSDNLLEVLTPRETVDFSRLLLQMGYVTAERDDNVKCNHCTELTLINLKDFASTPWSTTD